MEQPIPGRPSIQKDFADERTKTELIDTETAIIPVEGMTCFTCEIAVSPSLKKINGVVDAKASARQEKAQVKYDPSKTTISQLKKL